MINELVSWAPEYISSNLLTHSYTKLWTYRDGTV